VDPPYHPLSAPGGATFLGRHIFGRHIFGRHIFGRHGATARYLAARGG
jgi:hypothetical protein